ncbi:3-oxoacyl-[acyl-carrier-protein] reductase family protein [Bordetella pertussis STO1-CHOC-0018]|nr:3-oxoacyl-[acyl-carrier-protein] reductase family protein [Bordetella pertussis STO1-CHOC-0018]
MSRSTPRTPRRWPDSAPAPRRSTSWSTMSAPTSTRSFPGRPRRTGARCWPSTWRVRSPSRWACCPACRRRASARIVNVSSEAGRLGSRGGAVYAAAKAGLLGFTRSIARENARYGVTANAVLPGPVDTPMLARAVDVAGAQMRADLEALTLLRRLGRPEEVAAAIAFLCSEAAGFITGEALGVSGGMGCGA